MTACRLLSVSLVAAMLVGCFDEPGSESDTAGSSSGTSTGASGSGRVSSTGDDPASTSGSASMSASATESMGDTSSTGTSTSIGDSSSSSSGSGTLGETTTTGDPPAVCDAGFEGLTTLILAELATVTFTDPQGHADVTLVLEQGTATLLFSYESAVPGGLGVVWTFTGTPAGEFVPGPATVTFLGTDPASMPFESICEVELS